MRNHGLAVWIVPFLVLPVSAQEPRFEELRGMIPQTSRVTSVVALADLDGDTDLDLFAATPGQDEVFLNDGWGIFLRSEASLPLVDDQTNAVAFGDVDGDLDLDALVSNFGSGAAAVDRLLLNDGSGAFSDASANLPPLATSGGVALFDMDGDLDLDAVLGNALLENDGTGVFGDVSSNVPTHVSSGVAVLDRDMDGDLDLIFGSAGDQSGSANLRDNDGTGVFTDVDSNLPPFSNFDDTTRPVVGDLDGDGAPDVAFASGLIYRNDGFGVFSHGAFSLGVPLGSGVVLCDFDLDGDLDALLSDYGMLSGTGFDAQNGLFLNNGIGGFSDATIRLPDDDLTDGDLAVGDVDGDGDADFVCASQQCRLYLNNGRAFFSSGQAPLPEDQGPGFTAVDEAFAVALGDIDGDGDVDAALTNSNDETLFGVSHSNHLYVNDGSGSFSVAPVPLPVQPGMAMDLAFVDVEADGDMDLLIASSTDNDGDGNGAHLALNDGFGTFADGDGQLSFSGGLHTMTLATGDVDGDGAQDALFGNSRGFNPQLLRNDGAGFFAKLGVLPVMSGDALDAGLADTDADGDLDAWFANFFFPNNLFVNDGAGGFVDGSAALPPIEGGTSLGFTDVDDDGLLDVYIGRNGDDRLLLSDGAGGFVDASATLPGNTTLTGRVAVGDVDGDGDEDLMLGCGSTLGSNNLGQPNRLLLKTPSGLQERTDLIPLDDDVTQDIALADLDGDLDLDAFLYGSKARVYQNVQRQLARRGDLRLDKPLRLELYGNPGALWILFLALGQDSTLVPPFGTFRLDPATTFKIAGGALNAAGKKVLEPFVPNDPDLVGLDVYFQALLGLPASFTNLESGRVGAF